MTPLFNPTADFAQVTDRLEPVTLRRADGSPATAVGHALRRAVTTREAATSDGRYTESDVRWHLSATDLPAPPRLGDRIVDQAGEPWTILDVRLAACGSRWQCTTRNLAVAGGLTDTITIRRELAVKGPNGAVERTWQDYRTNVRARIQTQAAERDEQHGRQSGIVRAKVYLAEQIIVDNGFRVVASDGTIWEVEGYEQPDSIAGLFTIRVMRRL